MPVSTAQHVMRMMIDAGMWVVDHPDDGVLRGRDDDGQLVALVVIRAGRIAYAEHRRRVFPFWATRSYDSQLDELYTDLKATNAQRAARRAASS
ncbi:MAG: hypothetical protein AB7R77_26280 [Ilumatobacteraceae bacterium]